MLILDFKTQTYLREEQIFDLQGLPKPRTVTAFQPESYLILPIKPKIYNTEFSTTGDKTTKSTTSALTVTAKIINPCNKCPKREWH